MFGARHGRSAQACSSDPAKKRGRLGSATRRHTGAAMTLRERLFPVDPPTPHVLMKTAFVGTWEAKFRGLGRLTGFLDDTLPRFSAADDDLGLGVVFLHRHHVEIGLKLLLERVGARLETSHRLRGLVEACATAFAERGWAAEWERLSTSSASTSASSTRWTRRGSPTGTRSTHGSVLFTATSRNSHRPAARSSNP
jgi:hypothetical protein